MPTRVTQCDDSQLCAELAGETAGVAFHSLYEGHPESRVVAESDNFALVVDIAPLTHGHTLLVPRDHYLSFGELPRALWGELDLFREHCLTLIASRYAQPTVMEHGSSSDMSAGSCISHAHWHIIPGAESALRVFEKDGLIGRNIRSWRELEDVARRNIPYFYYSFNRTHRVYTRGLGNRRQYIRIVIAELLGVPEPEWDWALTLHPEILRETVAELLSGPAEERSA